jgi:hypothetical protein
MIKITYQEAFVPDGSQSPGQQQQASLPYGNDLFEVVLKVIYSKKYPLCA